MSRREILLVHNGASLVGRNACERAVGILRAGGYDPRPLSAATAQALSRNLTATLRNASTRIAAVVAVGGDGMVHLVLQSLNRLREQGVEFPFGLIPAGSGNDLARFHGVPVGDVERAAGRVLRGLESPERSMDLVHVTCADGSHHVCATAVCLGLDARVNARANRWSSVTHSVKYVAALAVEAFSMRARRYDLSWTGPDGACHVSDRTLTFLALTNTSSIGGGLTIVPRADPTDGSGELFMVSDVGALRLAWLFPRLVLGTHESLREVTVVPATTATIAAHGIPSEPRDAAYGDGERLGPLPASLKVLPAAVRVLL
ncbi:diacylglycerol kinase family protein [Kocuria sp. KD4]|uniref:diacylglycerol/lipid kinase family protein n=1 Tax=Kocuria sp. KD4 TaxID=2719588 RepID=UPI0014279A02|nr:diacylglycerol kinase family protein [Kocuria sp. KD4]QIR70827.1 hypothetical protein HBK84_04920 [Kocuria sp. KD4]